MFNEVADEEGNFAGTYTFFDTNTDNEIEAEATLHVNTALRMPVAPEVDEININRVRIDGGDWIELVVGLNEYINFEEGEEFEWELGLESGTLEDIRMTVHFHGDQSVETSLTGTAIDTNLTLTFIPFGVLGDAVSCDITIDDVS